MLKKHTLQPDTALASGAVAVPANAPLTPADFTPATPAEKQSQLTLRDSVGFWRAGGRRFAKNPLAMVSLAVFLLIFLFAFLLPPLYPYRYEQQLRGSEDLGLMQYSAAEQARIDAGETVFPHIFGTDHLGRDYAVRLMMGTRVSLIIGIGASLLVLLIGATYGAISGYLGGKVDTVMMRIVDIFTTIPEILVIILLMVTLKFPLQKLADTAPAFAWIRTVGVPLVCIFIVFALLYWVNMARIVRGQVLTLKQSEFITAAKALGASGPRILTRHLLPNCVGTLIVVTTLQIPEAIFTESFLSFLGIGVAAPLPSLGSLATAAVGGLQSYPSRLFLPAVLITLLILALNLVGDGLRDAFDPKLKQ